MKLKEIFKVNFGHSRIYLKILPSLIISIIILDLLNFTFYNKIYFMLAFVWHFYMCFPGLEKRLEQRQYRFSLVKFAFVLNKKIHNLFKKPMDHKFSYLIRFLSPLVFTLTVLLLTKSGNPLFCLAGSTVYEVTFCLVNKFNKSGRPLFSEENL
jgi:hypothetical protein